eukprot:2464056-Rhodomonas_salina.1
MLTRVCFGAAGGLSGWSYEMLEPFGVCNAYGLFRSMTGVGPSVLDDHGRVVAQVARPELIIEVSNGEDCEDPVAQQDDDKKCHWLPYEFHYKPGNTARAPPWVAPHMPRLDWQMWFGALGYDWQAPTWLPTLLQKLAQQEDAVEELVGTHGVPFKQVLPTYMRVRKFLYDFTVRFETTEVMYEEPKGEATDLMRVCSKLGEQECRREHKHCQLKAEGCVNRVSMQHTIVSEQSPGWWNRREPSAFSPVLKVHEFSRKGYLPAGDSLPNMPISYHGQYIQKPEELAAACEASCRLYTECVAFTYLPLRGVCYLKTVSYPVRGQECEHDCWFFGVVKEHVRLKNSFVDTDSRVRFVQFAAAFALLLLLSQAPLLEAIQVDAQRNVCGRQCGWLATSGIQSVVCLWCSKQYVGESPGVVDQPTDGTERHPNRRDPSQGRCVAAVSRQYLCHLCAVTGTLLHPLKRSEHPQPDLERLNRNHEH